MSNFKTFAALIRTRFEALSKHELFTVDVSEDGLWLKYLSSFPDGTNPIFRERTEHDCSCCKQFIRNIGNVVAIIDGKMESIWAVEGAPAPYDFVTSALDFYVRSLKIDNIYRKSEPSYGTEKTFNELVFHHFHGKLAPKHYTKEVGTKLGEATATFQVSQRSLKELTPEAVTTVLELIDANSLYRGAEFRKNVAAFQELQTAYLAAKAKGLFIWANIDNKQMMIRNSAIGTLIDDLSTGVAEEKAIKSFEAKVAPANYKRPTATVTPAMIKAALATIEELGLEAALKRRFAKISDVTVNNVLFVDNEVRSSMKGSLEDLLMSSVVKTAPPANAIDDISIEDFMANVVPKCSSMELLLQNDHGGNFMSLTAPVEPECKKLFKWDNDFAWSYDGNVTDSLRQKVSNAGGRVDGVLRFSHTWNYDMERQNQSLMDLHVFMPGHTHNGQTGQQYGSGNGRRVGWNKRGDFASGGVQDVDYTVAPGDTTPVENITFPHMNKLPEGRYQFVVHNWDARSPNLSGFRAEIELNGIVYQYERLAPMKHHEWVTVAEAVLKDGVFTIEHKLIPTPHVTTKWGVQTQTMVKVQTIMASPNHWDGQQAGNKHWFFILEGCKNPNPARGIYNEYLNPTLEKHRKVFELLGDKTKCAVTDEQLSGVGFSSTVKATATIAVKGLGLYRTYNVQF